VLPGAGSDAEFVDVVAVTSFVDVVVISPVDDALAFELLVDIVCEILVELIHVLPVIVELLF